MRASTVLLCAIGVPMSIRATTFGYFSLANTLQKRSSYAARNTDPTARHPTRRPERPSITVTRSIRRTFPYRTGLANG